MLCLHGEKCRGEFSINGLSWYCSQPSTCHFKCSEEEEFIYNQVVKKFLATKQPPPKCCVKIAGSYPRSMEDLMLDPRGETPEVARNYAKMKVVSDKENHNLGRPYFVCPKRRNKCNYFVWGDQIIVEKPLCNHGKPSKLTTVKKEGSNKGRKFFCCAERKENSCKFSQWFKDQEELEG